MAYSFLFGGDTNETPESIRRKRELAMAIMGASPAPKNVGEGLNALGSGIVAGVLNRRASKAEGEGRSAADALFQKIVGSASNVSASSADGGPVSSEPAGSPSAAAPINMSGNDVYSGFMDTVDDVITNPFGLAAVAATGQAESRFSPKNANRTWSDPSESGQAGTAGGIMSWRGPRLSNLQAYAASKGEQGNGSPQTQAEFLVQEDPNLITALNNAKSVEEAQSIINRAWKFAGYDRPGGEAAERLATANAFLPNFQGQGQPQQVASLDPSIGVPSARPQPNTSAQATAAPAQPSLTEEVAAFEQTPEYRAQFPGMNAQPTQAPQPQQVAQAQPPQPQAPPQGPDQMTLLQALSNPFLSDEQRAVLQTLYQQQAQAAEAQREQQIWMERQRYEQEAKRSDPSYQLGLEKTRLELEEARKPKRQPLINAGNGNVYDPNEDKWLTPPTGGGTGQFRFSGNSVEAQALNGLMDSNQLTPEQAQQLAAGKTITGPNGEVIFLTPQGVFGQPAAGGQPQQMSAPEPTPQSQPRPSEQQAQGARVTPEGNIQVTAPKVTVDEKEAATFADRMNNSGALIDKFENAGLGAWDQAVRGNDYIPDFLENWLLSSDYQKFDQARRDFINAQLRRESGAVISSEEFDNANKQYFPQPGDPPELLEQKRLNRKTVIDGMKRSAGPTYGNKPRAEDDPLGIR